MDQYELMRLAGIPEGWTRFVSHSSPESDIAIWIGDAFKPLQERSEESGNA